MVGALAATALLFLTRPGAVLALLAAPLAVPPVRGVVVDRAAGPELVPALVATGRLQLAFGALLAAGVAVSA